MSYADAVDRLYALSLELAPTSSGSRRKFDLAHMRTLAAALDNPQSRFPSILIAGTNGKGSTAATLASILSNAGYRTGLYTSPHLIRVNERIQFSAPTMPSEYASVDAPTSAGQAHLLAISDDDFARIYFHVDDAGQKLVANGALPHMPSFFEMMTAIAFTYFAERRTEIAVLEVGLGGRLDATNIVDPILSVITDISLDHQDYLGSTIAEITREKAGILRQKGTLITLPQHPEANRVLGEVAATLPELHAISASPFLPPAERSTVRPADPTLESRAEKSKDAAASDHARMLRPNRYSLTIDGEDVLIDSPLPGQHQQRNIALAVSASVTLRNEKGYNIPNRAVETGVKDVVWPGRLELLPLDSGRELLLDVAHNTAGAWALRSAIAQLPEDRPRTLIFSCLRDKDLREMAQMLFPLFDSSSTDAARAHDHIFVAQISSPRAAGVDDLLAVASTLDIPVHAAAHVPAALAQASSATPAGGLIVATGSIYLVGELLRAVQERS